MPMPPSDRTRGRPPSGLPDIVEGADRAADRPAPAESPSGSSPRKARAGRGSWRAPTTDRTGRPPPRDIRSRWALATPLPSTERKPVGGGHDGLGARVLEHPQLPVEMGDRADLPDGLRAALHQTRGQDDDPCRRNDDHKDHGHQLLDLRSVQKNPNHRQFRSGGWSGNDSADIGRASAAHGTPRVRCAQFLHRPVGPAQLVDNGPGDRGPSPSLITTHRRRRSSPGAVGDGPGSALLSPGRADRPLWVDDFGRRRGRCGPKGIGGVRTSCLSERRVHLPPSPRSRCWPVRPVASFRRRTTAPLRTRLRQKCSPPSSWLLPEPFV